jgi:hypothetical protein
MEKQDMPLFLGCPSMFLFALVKKQFERQKKFNVFLPVKRNLVRKKCPLNGKAK